MNALELFTCSGGMAEGFRRAGLRFAHAFDADPDACDSYEANLGHRPTRMDVRDLVDLVANGWKPKRLDLLVADPPCTPWSRAGKRLGTADGRDMLRETVRLIALLKPHAYLIGNVPGLQDSTNWSVVQDLIGGLSRHGYCVNDYATLDAADFGVPQRRIRPFWFGHLHGPCIRWPLPTHGDPRELGGLLEDRKPWVTCREALGHLPLEHLGRIVGLRVRGSLSADPEKCGTKPRASDPDEPAHVVTAAEHGDGNQLLLNAKHMPSMPSETICAKDRGGAQGGRVVMLREPDPNRPPADPDAPHRSDTAVRDQALLAWPWDRPATTVYAGTEQLAQPGKGSPMSRGCAVVLSEHAAALLQGFPEGWTFAGKTKRSRWSQIGQAMPPALAEAVARSVIAQMYGRPLHGAGPWKRGG